VQSGRTHCSLGKPGADDALLDGWFFSATGTGVRSVPAWQRENYKVYGHISPEELQEERGHNDYEDGHES
jgi:hypothetical protein